MPPPGSSTASFSSTPHPASRIEIFRLNMRLEGEGEDEDSAFRQIDSRLLFAVRRGLRVLDLDIHYDSYPNEARYGLPPWIFHCRTLEDFSLRCCHLRLPSHIRLVSLKKMRLGLTTFHDDELKRLLLVCPLLQRLELVYCNKTSDLVIDARENRKFEELVIHDGYDDCHSTYSSVEMQICAPSVKYMTFNGAASRRQYEVRDLSSLVVASFDIDERKRVLYKNKAYVFTTCLLLRIHQVQVLKLCSWSLQFGTDNRVGGTRAAGNS